MKFKLLSALSCLLTIGLAVSPAQASADLDQLCTRFPQNSRCEGYVPMVDGERRDSDTGYRVLGTEDWRTSEDIPLSEPVIVNDPFDGNYLAVIDKNYSGSLAVGIGTRQEGIITNWSEQYIRVYAYLIEKPCSGINLFCPPSVTVRETSSLDIKVGDQVFRLEGTNGNFPVSPEVAAALRNAPPGPALTRITLEGSGSTITNEIGGGTTEAWHVVYQDLLTGPVPGEPSSTEATANEQ